MATITWRNVNTPNFGASNNLALAGAQNVQRGIEGVAAGLQDYGAKDKLETEGNIKSFIDSFRNQDDYLAARDSGAFSDEALTKAYGGNFDSRVAQQYAKDREGAINREEQAAYDQGQKGFLRQKDADAKEQYGRDQEASAATRAFDKVRGSLPSNASAIARRKQLQDTPEFKNLSSAAQREQLSRWNAEENEEYTRADNLLRREADNVLNEMNAASTAYSGNEGIQEALMFQALNNDNKYVREAAANFRSKVDSINNATAARVERATILDKKHQVEQAEARNDAIEPINVRSPESTEKFGKLYNRLDELGENSGNDLQKEINRMREEKYNGYDIPPEIFASVLERKRADQWLPWIKDIGEEGYIKAVEDEMDIYIEGILKGNKNTAGRQTLDFLEASRRFNNK